MFADATVSPVVVILNDKSEGGNAAAYRSPSGGDDLDDTKSILKDRRFMAILAPSCEAAMTYLQTQLPGTYLLTIEDDASIAVYIKFRQAVRALTLVVGKQVKKLDNAVHLATPSTNALDVVIVHTLHLATESYFVVEQCWKRFLPPVQAIVFELCCEPHVDEDLKLEEWKLSMIPSLTYAVGVMPKACGFYILTMSRDDTESISSVAQVRQVEFDFIKCVMTIADGTLKPSALFLPTSFGSKRIFEPDFTFGVIRDNFLTPGLVALKEVSVTTTRLEHYSFQNCIDLSSDDRELAVLCAVDAICEELTPHEPLPDLFLNTLQEMHSCFAETATRDGLLASSKPSLWSAQKMRVAGRIVPVLLEFMMAAAAPVNVDENEKNQFVAHLCHALRFDLFFMTARCDDFVICRLTHQVSRLFGAGIQLPIELIALARDLVALSPSFQRLFSRIQGLAILWKNLHTTHEDKDAGSVSSSYGKPALQSFASHRSSMNVFERKGERRILWFGAGKKAETKSRNLLLLGTSPTSLPLSRLQACAYLRLSISTVQMHLDFQLKKKVAALPKVWKAMARSSFCSCPRRPDSATHHDELHAVRSSVKIATYELMLQLSSRLLYHKTLFVNWDRHVALLLRLDEVYRHFFNDIVSIVRRQSQAQDIAMQQALFCELRVVIACVSTLFRLERKRRHDMSSTLGDKRYLHFVHFFKAKTRELYERLQMDDVFEDPQRKPQTQSRVQTDMIDPHFLSALADVLKWIPRAFLNEWIVVSLKDLLQTVSELSRVINQTAMPLTKQSECVCYARQIVRILTVMLSRTSDVEIQTLLVRVLGTNCPALISLLRLVLSVPSLDVDLGHDGVCIVLELLTAFVRLDVALPVQYDWDSRYKKCNDERGLNEDAEVFDQLKGELLIKLLSADAEQSEQTLYDYMLDLMFRNNDFSDTTSVNAALRLAFALQSVSTPPSFLTNDSREHFQTNEAFLLLQQALYTAHDKSSSIDFELCVVYHLQCIEQYSDRIITNKAHEELEMVHRIVELHLACLIVLASRRSQSSAIQHALNQARVLPVILQRLQHHHHAADRPHATTSGAVNEASATFSGVPSLQCPRRSSVDSSEVPTLSKLSLSPPIHSIAIAQNFILTEPRLHALALVLVTTYIIIDPNLEIDEALCPRIFVPGQTEEDSNHPSELLYTLQQHLADVDMDLNHFEALMVELDTLQAFVSPCRLSAIRLLLRMLCPNRYDCNLYAVQEDGARVREYVSKGAFSTVYRQHPALPQPQSVAVKVIEHQRRPGELCAVSGVFNEVSILSKLRGDLAATQVIDFGNNHTERCFDLVMEYCPCSLTEWRATMNQIDSKVPFRSCLMAILRAFVEACHCLTRIHRAGVCHFDIKSDNILVRSSPNVLSRRLLESHQRYTDNGFKGFLCFADFGEAKLVDTGWIPMQTCTFSSSFASMAIKRQTERRMSLTRTRGTEAIKSPEVLKIKGSEAEVKVTLASDVWSLGCLLYELVTQELLFQHDDWASLYAHLVVVQDQDVLRSDHIQKMFKAMQPRSSNEEAVLTNVTKLCSMILVRDPSRRPKLETIIAKVRNLINDVYALPLTTSDRIYMENLHQEAPSPADTRRVTALEPFTRITSVRPSLRPEVHNVLVPVRFFWNFFLAADVAKHQAIANVASCLECNNGTVGGELLAMDIFEAKYEAHFQHFVYVSWHESAASSEMPPPHTAQCFIKELYEEEHRTCVFLNRESFTSSSDLFQQLVQDKSRYFPMLQRRLRDEAGDVVLVVLARDSNDTADLQSVLTAMLLFFLRSALAVSPFALLSYFSRHCAPFVDYPEPDFLQHLVAFTSPCIQDTATSTIVQCPCGTSVFTVVSAALTDAQACQRCTCTRSISSCLCFHPFPIYDEALDNEDVMCSVDRLFVYESSEERLVLPMETRARQGDEVRWLIIDAAAVGRWSRAITKLKSSSSRFMLSRGRRIAGDEITMETRRELLVRGLRNRGNISPSSTKWQLYECELCRLPICAIHNGNDKVAVPMLESLRSE